MCLSKYIRYHRLGEKNAATQLQLLIEAGADFSQGINHADQNLTGNYILWGAYTYDTHRYTYHGYLLVFR